MGRLIKFQLGEDTDEQGRYIHDIWQLNTFWLEHDHKYIQWLFPIDAQTKFNRHAPVLTSQDREAFMSAQSLQQAMSSSLDVMLEFFGMTHKAGAIVPCSNLNMREHIWLKRAGHNHLRISRIIRSLRLCGQPEMSLAFLEGMLSAAEKYGEVSKESKRYWWQQVANSSALI